MPSSTHRPGSTPDGHDLLAVKLAEHYLVEEELGRAGSATVYLHSCRGTRLALDILESLLGVTGWVTPALLPSDPTWAALRDEPRFIRLAGSA